LKEALSEKNFNDLIIEWINNNKDKINSYPEITKTLKSIEFLNLTGYLD